MLPEGPDPFYMPPTPPNKVIATIWLLTLVIVIGIILYFFVWAVQTWHKFKTESQKQIKRL